MRELHKHWRSLLFRGILALLFGLIAIFWPGIGLSVIVLLFGIYILVDGIIAFVIGFPLKSILVILEGVLGIIVGGLIFFNMISAVFVFIYLVGIWAFITGVLELLAAVELRKFVANEIWLIFVGVVSILFGTVVFANPIAAGIALSFVIAVYALLFGSLLIVLAIQLKDYSAPKKKSSSKKRK